RGGAAGRRRAQEAARGAGGVRLERARLRQVEPTVVNAPPVGERRPPTPASDRAVAREPFLAVRDQARRDAVDRARVAVVIAHEGLDPKADRVVLIAEALRDRGLEPALQDVLLRPREAVQL